MFSKMHPEAGFLIISSNLAADFVVTKFASMFGINFAALCSAA
jgi:hypothetical protein